MSAIVRDRVAGATLLAVALIWIVLVYQTIEPSQSAAAGPRAFPLFFGLALVAMSLALLAQTFISSSAESEGGGQSVALNEKASIVMTIGALVAYGALLEPLGFIPSTIIIVAAMMLVVLRIWAPLTVAAMAFGLALGCYLVFGKLLGTYLPPGTIITIYF